MTKLYNKSKLMFSFVCILAYVVLASIGDSLSHAIGISKILTTPLLLVMSAVIYIWLSKSNLTRKYGIKGIRGKLSSMLFFIPLIILISMNLWNGVTLNMPVADTALYIVSMLLVGFLEEIIFRGFLFKSLSETGVKKAFIISSVTFGIGHIVNLFNGAEVLPTILQIISAIVIGFLFTALFYKTKSLWPCIITHGIFNSLSAFAVEPNATGRIILCILICLIAGLYSVYIMKSKRVLKNPKMY